MPKELCVGMLSHEPGGGHPHGFLPGLVVLVRLLFSLPHRIGICNTAAKIAVINLSLGEYNVITA